jgi:hypothetical protein
MTVPTPTYEDLDLSNGWTEYGTPTYVSDPINTGTAFQGDTVDNALERAEVLASGTQHTIQCWFKVPASHSTNGTLVSQTKNSGTDTGSFHLTIHASGGLQSRFMNNTPTDSIVSHGSSTFKDDTWRLGTVVLRTATDLDVYINGVEDGYLAQDSVSGNGADGTTNSSVPLSVGAYDQTSSSGKQFFGGAVARVKIWEGVALSSAQVLEEYNNELGAPSLEPVNTNYEGFNSTTEYKGELYDG